jgi:hypothetical protein
MLWDPNIIPPAQGGNEKLILMIRAGDSTNPELLERFQAKQITLREMPNSCVTIRNLGRSRSLPSVVAL